MRIIYAHSLHGSITVCPRNLTIRRKLLCSLGKPQISRILSSRFSDSRPHMEYIKIRGARTHNLKHISLDLPRNQLVVITGLSGSGKSSLAFDTLYAEGQRRYVESLSTYSTQFLEQM